MNFKIWIETTEQFTNKLIDPALLTFQEFWELINPQHKYHSDSAYDWPASKMTKRKEEYPQLLFRQIIQGITFEFRLNKKDRYQEEKFIKTDENNNPVTINGQTQYWTVEDLQRMQIRRYDYNFAVFDKEQQVATTQDEWGCLLVVVAQEYRKFGLGQIITKLAWEAEPGKDSGGCTPRGQGLVRKVHAQFVQEYLQKGFYSYLVKQKQITAQKVKDILASVDLTQKPKQEKDLGDDPADWLLYAEDGSFIIYNKKLKDFIDEEETFWAEKFIKASAFVGGAYTDKVYILHHVGGETEQLKKFMMLLALSWAKEENDSLKVYDEDMPLVDKTKTEIKENKVSLTGEPIKYKGMAAQEKKWRKTFDKYDQFRVRLLEMAEAKYRGY